MEILISKREIEERIKTLAKEIDDYYNGEMITIVCILKGGVIFMTDLIRQLKTSVKIEFLCISSYGNECYSSNNIKLEMDLRNSIVGENILIVEDIIDTGLSLKYIYNLLEKKNPKQIKIAVLLEKKENKLPLVDIQPDFIGFNIKNEFVVGYGLDYSELYRDLPYIGILNFK